MFFWQNARMDIYKINVAKQINAFNKSLDDLQRTQLPFAASKAINSVAQMVKQAELANFRTKFDNPTPFTMKAIGVIPAMKRNLTATIFVKDDQAPYLAPYEF